MIHGCDDMFSRVNHALSTWTMPATHRTTQAQPNLAPQSQVQSAHFHTPPVKGLHLLVGQQMSLINRWRNTRYVDNCLSVCLSTASKYVSQSLLVAGQSWLFHSNSRIYPCPSKLATSQKALFINQRNYALIYCFFYENLHLSRERQRERENK